MVTAKLPAHPGKPSGRAENAVTNQAFNQRDNLYLTFSKMKQLYGIDPPVSHRVWRDVWQPLRIATWRRSITLVQTIQQELRRPR